MGWLGGSMNANGGTSVLVTGASRGIGRACAKAFAGCGWRVGIHYHEDQEAAESLVGSLPGGPHPIFKADLGDAADCTALAESAWRELDGLDALVNNAGLYIEHPPLELDDEQWDTAWERTLAVNLRGPAMLCHRLGRRMAAAGGGRIVNVSSRGAFRGEPTAPAYGASKAGLNALGQSLAKAMATAGVLIFTVAPGWVDTDMTMNFLASDAGAEIKSQSPLNRVAEADEIADGVIWLATKAPAFATGAILDLNGASYLRS